MIADAQKQLEEIVAKEGAPAQGGGDDEEEEDDEGRIEEASELLQSIKDNLEANQGRLDDQVGIFVI